MGCRVVRGGRCVAGGRLWGVCAFDHSPSAALAVSPVPTEPSENDDLTGDEYWQGIWIMSSPKVR